jgi:serine protease inhibitor
MYSIVSFTGGRVETKKRGRLLYGTIPKNTHCLGLFHKIKAESIILHKELINVIGIKIQILNGFFIDKQIYNKITPKYTEFIKKIGANKQIDIKNRNNAINTINTWVKDTTRGLISNLVSNNDINDLTKMVIVNVIYFKGILVKGFMLSSRTHLFDT